MMESFIKKLEIRWADLDPNFHVLHSRYYDFGAYSRMALLTENGLTPELMSQHHVGPIIFREECFFKKEIVFGDEVSISFKLSKITPDYSRWSMEHEIFINGKNLAAAINIDGAWMDTIKRKLTVPPPIVHSLFDKAPKTDAFSIVIK
jgi:acyl-CoA thioester hydrolase